MFASKRLTHFVPWVLVLCGLLVSFVALPSKPALAASSGLVISEYLANPAGSDSPFEYVELVATQSIDFAVTPYSVVFADNGIATAEGWVTGGAITYGFNITNGSVNIGDVVYVGGSSMKPTGTKLRTINTADVPGDRFGNADLTGVLGNGGANADGVAVFAANINTLTRDTVPADAVFFGAGTGASVIGGGTAGYQLPVNDLYAGGKLQSGSALATDPASTQIVAATGTYEVDAGGFTTPRSWAVAPASDGVTGITVVPHINKPIALACPDSLFAAPETAGSAVISATDPDGIVSAPQLVSGAVAGITLTNATAATTVGGTASATLNLAADTTPGSYSVKLNVSNNDTPPLVNECTISVGFVTTTENVYLPIVSKP